MWLGKWALNDMKPVKLKWVKSPTKILGNYVLYDEAGNNNFNFNLKIQKLQSNLDMWKSRALTLYGKVLIIKSLGISQLVHSFSNCYIPRGILETVKTKLFKFLWNNKRDKIKREGIYQNYDKGGLRMVDIDITAKSLRLVWISRLRQSGASNWSIIPNYFFNKCGGLNFLLRCDYDSKYIEGVPKFYREMLDYFKELKDLYQNHEDQNTILVIGGKPVFYREWFSKGIISIEQLLNENSKFMTFTDFQLKYRCKTNFLQFYQIISAIPSHLLTIAQQRISSLSSNYTDSSTMFLLDPTTQVDYLSKLKANNIYQLLNNKIHTVDQTGTQN